MKVFSLNSFPAIYAARDSVCIYLNLNSGITLCMYVFQHNSRTPKQYSAAGDFTFDSGTPQSAKGKKRAREESPPAATVENGGQLDFFVILSTVEPLYKDTHLIRYWSQLDRIVYKTVLYIMYMYNNVLYTV